MSEGTRRLAAVMFTDMVGYTALGQRNESLSLALVEEQRRLVRPILYRHNGREVKTMGDAFLVEFPSALDAVRCAYNIQRAAKEFNVSMSEDQKIHLRVGIHLGDIVETQGDISGDAVNVAARIEPLAEDGGVCLTRQVYDHVQNKFEVPITSLGARSLKNVSQPVEVYKMSMPWGERKDEPAPRLDRRRIAVLPFMNMSPDPSDEYFADGMTEELITSLSGIRELAVIARTSVMKYKGASKGASEVATELNAGTLIEGSVRKAGDRVRITVQLIDAQTESHRWAQNYDKQLDDVFAIQTEVAQKVAEELKVQIAGSEGNALGRRPTENTEAYTLYLKGRYFWNERSKEGLEKARQYFEKSIALDPAFSRAYSGLSDTYWIMAFQGLIPSEEGMRKAKFLAEKAVELDDTLAEAHASLASIHEHQFEWSKAEADYSRAIELSPSYATAHFWYGIHLTWLHRYDEAIEHSRRAEELDPLSPSMSIALGQALTYSKRYDEGIRHLDRKIQSDPGLSAPYFIRGIAYFAKGMYDRTEMDQRKAISLGDESFRVTGVLGAALAEMGRESEARAILAGLERANAPKVMLAAVHLGLHEKDLAVKCLEEAYQTREAGLGWVSVIPQFQALRSDPRFTAILRGMNLPQE